MTALCECFEGSLSNEHTCRSSRHQKFILWNLISIKSRRVLAQRADTACEYITYSPTSFLAASIVYVNGVFTISDNVKDALSHNNTVAKKLAHASSLANFWIILLFENPQIIRQGLRVGKVLLCRRYLV